MSLGRHGMSLVQCLHAVAGFVASQTKADNSSIIQCGANFTVYLAAAHVAGDALHFLFKQQSRPWLSNNWQLCCGLTVCAPKMQGHPLPPGRGNF